MTPILCWLWKHSWAFVINNVTRQGHFECRRCGVSTLNEWPPTPHPIPPPPIQAGKRIHATRQQLEEWIGYKSGELSIRDVSDDTLILMAEGMQPGDVVVMPSGEYVKRPAGTDCGHLDAEYFGRPGVDGEPGL